MVSYGTSNHGTGEYDTYVTLLTSQLKVETETNFRQLYFRLCYFVNNDFFRKMFFLL